MAKYVNRNKPAEKKIFQRDNIDEILERADIIQLLNTFYNLGLEHDRGDEYICRCPFPNHEDKSPSFRVNSEKGMYHCWGCNEKGGSIIDLIMELDGSDFITALKKLKSMSNYSGEKINGSFISTKKIVETGLPNNWTADEYMNRLALLLRPFELAHPDKIEWVNKVYIKADAFDDNEDTEGLTRLWNFINQKIKELD